ncbi:CHASE2 domain-containing protein [Oscillatoria sp. HE19RPO]|uniref:CHASE2 domain-containing protein n=1 Tax=Oscillatoria sp. HE19RPO TaxID=2954806 RepID=UPI0020C47BEC|nr:adenylate/guanylate cyclase domain-containing protein [Oscillatoria sp. HE19RPO]
MWKQWIPRVGKEWWAVFLGSTTIAGLVVLLRLTGALQGMEWRAFDWFIRSRPQEPRDSRIVIVGISETDIQTIGQWPIPDGVIAELITRLKAQQPRAIGLDIYRDLPVEPGHQRLIEVFDVTPNLIGVKTITDGDILWGINPPPILSDRGQIAANNILLDPDGTVRRGLLYLENQKQEVFPSLAVSLAFLYLESEGIIPKNSEVNPDSLQLGEAVFRRFRKNDGGYVRTEEEGYQIFMNFRGPRATFETVSLTDVLDNKIPEDFARNQIVLIGSTAASLQDYFLTPYDNRLTDTPERTSGVEIHANLTSQLISAALDNRTLIQVWSAPLEIGLIFLGAWIGGILAGLGRYVPGKNAYDALIWVGFSVVIATIIITGTTFLAFWRGWWIPVVPPLLSLAGSTITITAYIANIERQERQSVMRLFERHVTPKIAQAIWNNRQKILSEGQLEAQEVTATVLFTDLKEFSGIAEGMTPKLLMSWLNEYMSAMAKVVLDSDGAIDKFIGDAVMAVFGVPLPATTPEEIALDAQKAVTCALGMAAALESLNQQWERTGKPTVSMRVGIATGPLVVGSLGSHQRQDYTIIGDTVNIASRLESYDKSLEGGICRILISEETYRLLPKRFSTKRVDRVLLKGRKQPVNVYQVWGEEISKSDS